MTTQHKLSWSGLLHLAVVYTVWGGTYLAIRFAVRDGSGFPPFIMAASRFLLGGLVLLMWAAMLRQSLRVSKRDMALLFVSAVLLFNGGNGMVTWAERRADSGYAALVVGTSPIWAALIEALWDRKKPSLTLVFSLLTGFAGLALLTVPVMKSGVRADGLATLALTCAPLSWALGSIIQQRNPQALPPMASSGYQQLFSIVGFSALALATGEQMPHPTTDAWLGWGYLVVFGSIIAFTSYVKALRALPLPIVMTYAYVNPVIAVLAGSLFLHETITRSTLGGMALILLGVGGVFRDRFRR